MKQLFYLVPEGECGDPILVRECLFLRAFLARPTNQQLYLVAVSPHVETVDSHGEKVVADSLLLHTVGGRSLEQTVAEEYVINIYCSTRLPTPPSDSIDLTNTIGLGMGSLHPTRQKAEVQLARDMGL